MRRLQKKGSRKRLDLGKQMYRLSSHVGGINWMWTLSVGEKEMLAIQVQCNC